MRQLRDTVIHAAGDEVEPINNNHRTHLIATEENLIKGILEWSWTI